MYLSAQTSPEWTSGNAKKWMKSAVWSNGWTVSPHKSVNAVEFACQYHKNKAYKAEDVYFEFAHEIMSNAQENAQIELTEAQVRQTEINTILNVASILNDETIIKAICDWLDIDYEEIKDKLPKNEEENTKETQKVLDNINTDGENGGGADGK